MFSLWGVCLYPVTPVVLLRNDNKKKLCFYFPLLFYLNTFTRFFSRYDLFTVCPRFASRSLSSAMIRTGACAGCSFQAASRLRSHGKSSRCSPFLLSPENSPLERILLNPRISSISLISCLPRNRTIFEIFCMGMFC